MIIVIGHVKGGVGKSTLITNLAVELQARGNSVIVVEADPTISTTSAWGSDRAEDGSLKDITVVMKYGDVASTLTEFDATYDYVLVDTAGKDSRELRSALTVSDALLAPQVPSQADLDALDALEESVKKARQGNPDLTALVIIMRAATHPGSTEVSEARQVIADYAELEAAEAVIRERKAYRHALATGKGAVEWTDRKAKAEIQVLANELVGE